MGAAARAVALVLAGLAVGLPACDRSPDASAPAPGGPVTIKFWHPWGTELKAATEAIVKEFEASHPGIKVEPSYASNNLTSSQKLFLAIAGGCPPEVSFVDGQQLAEWAARGALTDITDEVAQAGLKADDFWLPRWKESVFAGRVYALPWGADPNFAFAWNKTAFRNVGLDPDKPPRTIAELDAANDKLTKVEAGGRIAQIGIIPWNVFGTDNSMFTWGYAFGGDFYREPPPGQVIGQTTAAHPRNVAALRWIASYAQKYDVRKVSAFQSNFLGQAENPFFTGRVAMCCLHVTQLRDIERYAPTLEYGLSPIPAPPDGEYPTGWIGGWSLGIPRGIADPKKRAAAFEFVRWFCTDDRATVAAGVHMQQFPAYRKSPHYEQVRAFLAQRAAGGGATAPAGAGLSKIELRRMEYQAAFYEIVSHSQHTRTLMPVQGYFMDLLRRAVDDALYDEHADARKLLEEVDQKAQLRLEQVLGQIARKKEHEGGT